MNLTTVNLTTRLIALVECTARPQERNDNAMSESDKYKMTACGQGSLEGKVALITGTGGGQGRAAAMLFAEAGCRVVGCDLKKDGAEEKVELVKAAASSTAQATLELAQEFIRAVEAKDYDAVAQTLSPGAHQLFMHTGRSRTAGDIANIVSSSKKGFCVADLKGKAEILTYYGALFRKFTPLVWRNHEWTVSDKGQVFFSGNGDMAVTWNRKPYRNNYVTRFDVENGQIVNIAEYANAFTYSGLGVRPNGAEFRALLQAIGRMVNPWQSSTSGN